MDDNETVVLRLPGTCGWETASRAESTFPRVSTTVWRADDLGRLAGWLAFRSDLTERTVLDALRMLEPDAALVFTRDALPRTPRAEAACPRAACHRWLPRLDGPGIACMHCAASERREATPDDPSTDTTEVLRRTGTDPRRWRYTVVRADGSARDAHDIYELKVRGLADVLAGHYGHGAAAVLDALYAMAPGDVLTFRPGGELPRPKAHDPARAAWEQTRAGLAAALDAARSVAYEGVVRDRADTWTWWSGGTRLFRGDLATTADALAQNYRLAASALRGALGAMAVGDAVRAGRDGAGAPRLAAACVPVAARPPDACGRSYTLRDGWEWRCVAAAGHAGGCVPSPDARARIATLRAPADRAAYPPPDAKPGDPALSVMTPDGWRDAAVRAAPMPLARALAWAESRRTHGPGEPRWIAAVTALRDVLDDAGEDHDPAAAPCTHAGALDALAAAAERAIRTRGGEALVTVARVMAAVEACDALERAWAAGECPR